MGALPMRPALGQKPHKWRPSLGAGVVGSQCGILRRSLRASFARMAALAVAFAFAPAAFAQIVVSNTADSGAGSLTAAITAANASPGSTITFSLAANSTIALTGPLPAINANVTIDGSGSSGLTISGGNSSRVFFVLGGNAHHRQRQRDRRCWRHGRQRRRRRAGRGRRHLRQRRHHHHHQCQFLRQWRDRRRRWRRQRQRHSFWRRRWRPRRQWR
jgi:hypothetical protein